MTDLPEPRLPAVFNLVSLDSVGSTNDEARKLALQGEDVAPDGTVVFAREQTGGKGRRGRSWDTPRGNFAASFVLRPEVPLSDASQLGFVASLAVFDAIGNVGEPGHQVTMKWPNDVLLNGRKLGGLLMEAEGGSATTPAKFLILGIGLNLMHYPDEADFEATSMAAEGMPPVPPQVFLEALCLALIEWVGIWMDGDFEKVRKTWLFRAQGQGKPIKVQLEGETIEGTFQDIDENGALVLKIAGTQRKITAGDVFFPAQAGA